MATFKQFQMTNSEENKEKCREANVNSRKSVGTAKAPAYEYLYGKLDSRKRIKMVYRLAKTSGRRSKINIYISDMPFINSLGGQLLTVGGEIILRRQKYVDGLLNTSFLSGVTTRLPPNNGCRI